MQELPVADKPTQFEASSDFENWSISPALELFTTFCRRSTDSAEALLRRNHFSIILIMIIMGFSSRSTSRLLSCKANWLQLSVSMSHRAFAGFRWLLVELYHSALSSSAIRRAARLPHTRRLPALNFPILKNSKINSSQLTSPTGYKLER